MHPSSERYSERYTVRKPRATAAFAHLPFPPAFLLKLAAARLQTLYAYRFVAVRTCAFTYAAKTARLLSARSIREGHITSAVPIGLRTAERSRHAPVARCRLSAARAMRVWGLSDVHSDYKENLSW